MIEPRLTCAACERSVGLASTRWRCRACGGPLVIRGDVRDARPDHRATSLLARYRSFLPFAQFPPPPSLGEGDTPLLPSTSLGPLLDLDRLSFKLEYLNPTGTTLDRGSAAAVRRAQELGFTWIGVVSASALGISTAAYAARAGLSCAVVYPAAPDPIVGGLGLSGARLIQIDGSAAALCAASTRAGLRARVYFANADDPFRIEGQKTLAYELADMCPDGRPEYVVMPGDPPPAVDPLVKGFREWRAAGLADAEPVVVDVRWASLSGPKGDSTLVVDDREVRAAQTLLATQEGLAVAPESAVAFAGLVRAVRSRRVPRGSRVVVVLSGRPPVEPGPGEELDVRSIRTSLRGLARALAEPAP